MRIGTNERVALSSVLVLEEGNLCDVESLHVGPLCFCCHEGSDVIQLNFLIPEKFEFVPFVCDEATILP